MVKAKRLNEGGRAVIKDGGKVFVGYNEYTPPLLSSQQNRTKNV